jgi:biopolymer transport protein ExbD
MNNGRCRNLTSKPEINVTPLIDVLLVLLIIFLVIGPIIPRNFETKLPEKLKQEKPDIDYPALVVTVRANGDYLLNLDPVSTLADLQGLLHRVLEKRPYDGKAVFIKAPRSAGYGEIVKVIDIMKAAGSAPIGLQIEGLEQ